MKLFERNEISKEIGHIIACGINPVTKDLVILTKDGILKQLNVNDFFKSDRIIEDSYPIKQGFMIEFVEKDVIIVVDSEDILNESNELQLVDLEIGINHENQAVDTEKND